jgi:DNA-binding PadR family transcriptional regulator
MRGIRSTRNMVALTVLALVSERPRHPYEMQRCMRERHKDYASGRTRALYHAVDRLVREGLIEPAETSREGRRPERTVYRITPEGRDEFEAWVTELLETPVNDEYPLFMVATSFLSYLTPEAGLRALQQRAATAEVGLAAFEAVQHALSDRLGLTRILLIENEYQLVLARAELKWLRSLIDDIRTGRLIWEPGFPDLQVAARAVAELEAEHVI